MDDAPLSGEWLAGASDAIAPASHFAEGTPELVAPGDPVPTFRTLGGPLVPDLSRLPRERWREALIPCPPAIRSAAAFNARLGPAGIAAALELVRGLPPRPSDLARLDVPTVPFERVGAVRRRGRQLNMRITDEAYADLVVASRLLGGTPTQVARMMVNAGVRRLLADYDVALDRRTAMVTRT